MSIAGSWSFTLGLKELLVGMWTLQQVDCTNAYTVGDSGIMKHISHFKLWIDLFICQMVSAVQKKTQ